MSTRPWHLYSIETPKKDGIYEVRLTKIYDSLSCPVESLMEYKDGNWILRVPAFINEYKVTSWRNLK